jgi:hypothetical protein
VDIEVCNDWVRVGIVPIDMDEIYLVFELTGKTAHGRHIRSSGASPVGIDVEELDMQGFSDGRDIRAGVEAAFRAAGESGEEVGTGICVLG